MGEGVEVERGGVALGVLESFLASRGVSSHSQSTSSDQQLQSLQHSRSTDT